MQDSGKRNTVKSHIKALGLYNFIRDFGWANKRGGLISGGYISGIKNVSQRRDKLRYLEIKEEFGKAMKKIAGCGT